LGGRQTKSGRDSKTRGEKKAWSFSRRGGGKKEGVKYVRRIILKELNDKLMRKPVPERTRVQAGARTSNPEWTYQEASEKLFTECPRAIRKGARATKTSSPIEGRLSREELNPTDLVTLMDELKDGALVMQGLQKWGKNSKGSCYETKKRGGGVTFIPLLEPDPFFGNSRQRKWMTGTLSDGREGQPQKNK